MNPKDRRLTQDLTFGHGSEVRGDPRAALRSRSQGTAGGSARALPSQKSPCGSHVKGVYAGGCLNSPPRDPRSTPVRLPWIRRPQPAASVQLKDSNLRIDGSARADSIDVRRAANGDYLVTVNGRQQKFAAGTVKSISIAGKDGNDRIQIGKGVDANLLVDGGRGNDQIVRQGARGNAVVKGGAGNNVIVNRGDRARIDGGSGNDIIRSYGNRNKIQGGAGNDRIESRGNFNRIDGGDGRDRINSQGNWNRISGGKGRDSITSRGAGNRVICGPEDRVRASSSTRQSSGRRDPRAFTPR